MCDSIDASKLLFPVIPYFIRLMGSWGSMLCLKKRTIQSRSEDLVVTHSEHGRNQMNGINSRGSKSPKPTELLIWKAWQVGCRSAGPSQIGKSFIWIIPLILLKESLSFNDRTFSSMRWGIIDWTSSTDLLERIMRASCQIVQVLSTLRRIVSYPNYLKMETWILNWKSRWLNRDVYI